VKAAALAVLFIGNSLTAANDLPHLVQRIAQAAGVSIEVASVAKPNFSLEDHWNDGEAARVIASRRWNLVVLQQGPSALPESQRLLLEFARRFDRPIRAAGARPALYMVWPSSQRSGDFANVSASYRAAARAINGQLAPAGDAWRAAWRRNPGLALYGADGFHPSARGSVLAAMTIVRCVAGRLPASIRIDGISQADVTLFRSAVEEVASVDCAGRRSRRGDQAGARERVAVPEAPSEVAPHHIRRAEVPKRSRVVPRRTDVGNRQPPARRQNPPCLHDGFGALRLAGDVVNRQARDDEIE
jgi:hypothetical protein